MLPFRRLAAWRRAHALALHVHEVTESLGTRRHWSLVAQMRRAAVSIAANIAEGSGRASEAEFAHFLAIALASARELDYHALLAKDLALVTPSDYARLEARVDEVCRILVVLRRKVVEKAEGTRRAKRGKRPSDSS